MTSENFVYWLQGLFELGGEHIKTLDEKQVQIIKDHLNYVFIHSVPQTQPVVAEPTKIDVQVTGSGATTKTTPYTLPPGIGSITQEDIKKMIEDSRKQWPQGSDKKYIGGLGGITGTGMGAVVC